MEDKKILVVEDNVMNLELVSDLLEAHGFSVVQAQSGAAAIELAEKEQPDLILMDLQLPEMDGLEATRRLKQNRLTNSIDVVALTAHAMLGDEEKAREAGCSGYIAKPINTREFAEVISGFLDGGPHTAEAD
ncbi:MAG: response regulator [Actinobacteria bacterium]|nr:response regulator [Actinomycetota bacterium]MCL5882829.1 response regulator [Actinomycetota bacterium]